MASQDEMMVVNTHSIEKNRDNPRMLFDKPELAVLQKSIKLRGILIPLTVYRDEGDKLVLLDGERRLRCAKTLGLDKVPVNVIAKPSRTGNIIRMFNIHNVRKGWEVVPTAYSLARLAGLLEEEGGKATDLELSKLTGMSKMRVGECRRIMKYKEYHHLSLDENPKKRIGGDFFSQMDLALDKLKTFPEIISQYPEKKLVEIIIEKKLDGTIGNMLADFRMLKRILSDRGKSVPRSQIVDNVIEFLRSKPSGKKDSRGRYTIPALSMTEVYDRTISVVFTEAEIVKIAGKLENLLRETKYSEAKDKQLFKTLLDSLVLEINNTLER